MSSICLAVGRDEVTEMLLERSIVFDCPAGHWYFTGDSIENQPVIMVREMRDGVMIETVHDWCCVDYDYYDGGEEWEYDAYEPEDIWDDNNWPSARKKR